MPDNPDPKRDTLARRGTLHPHPERVTDELLLSDPFFDPRDLVQVKYEMLRRVRVDGQPIRKAADEAGLSRPTFYQAQAAFDTEGLPGLLPSKKGPRRAHKLSELVMDFVEQQLADEPAPGTGELVQRIRERFGLTVHPRSVERALTRRQQEKKTP